jgi:DNA mismatch repair protein MutL
VSRIRRLPEHLVNKIAAGEVVERPASVVKELVENALDAEARTIAVDLRDGGAALVRVADDGAGMTADELALALERHATSKIADAADLEAVATLGFRGEALPAICAVSRFTITSRARSEPEGTQVAGAGGAIGRRLTVAAEPGTTVEVTDLFYNTPARLKFLKAPATETAASLRAVTLLALAHPEVRFQVTSNGRSTFTAPAAATLRSRAAAVWGWEMAERLLEIRRDEHGVTAEGLASPPGLTRGGREDLVVIVNGRPVRDPALVQAVVEAYRPLLPRDRFPLVVLRLTLPAADVDANVHPTKAWVRFRHPRLVQETIAVALGQALRQPAVVPGIARPGPAPEPWTAGPAPGDTPPQPALFAEPEAPYSAGGFGRVLGQVQDTFVVAASEREVFFVDQHAAHERVVFERLRAELAAGAPISQRLLFGEPLDLSPAARAALERWREPLEHLGFVFEAFGGGMVRLRAVPAVLEAEEPKRLVEALVEEFAGPRAAAPVLDRALAFVACRAAIKADTPLDREQMERLVSDLGRTATPYFCPHGRPTMSRVALADIRREVRRSW